jgi:hypothetical protein
MHSHGRAKPPACGLVRLVVVFSAMLIASGCLGPKAVSLTRLNYNEAYRTTNDEQLLMNIVRLRYADSPVFIDLPNITSQFEMSASGNYLGGTGNQFPGRTNLGFGDLGARDTPTLSYHPREGKEIAKALLTPLTAELFSVVTAGANTEQLLLMALNDSNDVPNAIRSTIMMPPVPGDNSVFRRGVQQLARLIEKDAVELSFDTLEDAEASSDPIPTRQLRGDDLLSAAKEGYVFRARGEKGMALLKRDKVLVLHVHKEFLDSPELEEFTRIFRVRPGLRTYRIKSELTEKVGGKPDALPADDTLYMNMRSILQVMIFLAKGVSVPEEHVIAGVVPTTVGRDGSVYDWTRVTAGVFSVHAQKHRPRNAEIAVHYRGYWYYIACDDVSSRAVISVLEILFSLEESAERPGGPLLTLPLGG